MAVTRINNNQITDAATGNIYVGINAGTKLQNYSITATKIANNLTYGSDLTITGNLTVQGNTTTIDTTIVTIEDPLILLASGQTGSPTTDIGFIGQRGTSENIAFVWDESAQEFVTAFTSTAESNTVITITGYANLQSYNTTVAGNLVVVGTTSLTGNVLGDANIIGTVNGGNLQTTGYVSATGNLAGGNVNTAGTISSTGTMTGGNIATGGFVSATGNVSGGNINTAGNVSATGNVIANHFIGNISGNLTAPGANTEVIFNDGGVANAVSGLTFTKTSNALFVGGTVSATGTITGGNIATAGTVSATGDISGANFSVAGNIIPMSNVSYSLGNTTNWWNSLYISGTTIYMGNLELKEPSANTFAVYRADGVTLADFSIATATATGNITGGNLLTGGLVSSTGTVTGGNLFTEGTANITNTATVGNLNTGGTISATANIAGGNINTGGLVSATGNVYGGNVVTTGSGGDITGGGNISVGGFVSATGNVDGGNINTAGLMTAVGNIDTGLFFHGDGRYISNVTASSANAETLTGTFISANVTGSSLTSVGDLISVSIVGNTITGNLATGGQISATANVTGGNVLTAGLISSTGDVTGGNLATGGTVSATGTVTGGNLATGGTASATGDITGGNLYTGGNVSATGTISATATITGGNVDTAGTVSATGNVTGGNVLTAGYVTATGNVTGGNVLTAGYVTATGDVTGGNLYTGGEASVTGNITGGNVNTAQVYGSGALVLAAGTGNIDLNTTGNIVLANTIINGLAQPLQNQDAATKLYVDTIATTGITIHEEVFATTNTDLATATGGSISYTQPNGVSNGIGAYIQTTGSFTTIDTANVQTVGTRILVKNEGNAVLNGVYTYSNATAIVRALDADVYGSDSAESFSVNDYFFTSSGNVNAGSAFVVDAPTGTITFGTSNITFAQFSSAQVYSANIAAGLSLVGTVFSAKVDNDTTAFDGGGNISVKASANLTTPNIGAATGTSLSVTGTVTGGNLATGGTISGTGTITGGNVDTGGTVSATGTITGGNVATAGTVSATANITGGNVLTGGLISSTGTITSFDTITGGNVSTGGFVTATGNVTGGNVLTGGLISSTGTVTGGNLDTGGTISATSTITGGNLATGGTISATANITGGNVLTGGLISAAGNITAGSGSYFLGDGSLLTGVAAASVDAGNLVGNTLSANVLFSSLTSVGALTTLSVVGTAQTGNLQTAGIVSATGDITGGNINTGGAISATATITGGNVATGGAVSATGNVTGGNLVTSGLATVTGNVIGGNVVTGGLISATGDVTGGNLATGGTVSATGTITGGNVETGGTISSVGTATVGNLVTGGIVSATSTVTGGNIATGGQISALGNILTSGLISATGTVTVGNLDTAGNVSATGNVYAANFIGNVSGNITAPGANTEVIFNNSGIADATSGFTFDYTSNAVTVTGTVNGGNLATGGTASATGNITGGNVLTGGLISATGNVEGGNINSGGIVNVTGNIYGGNLETVGDVFALGNATADYFITNLGGIDSNAANLWLNVSQLDVNTGIYDDGGNIVFYVDAGTGTASFGSATQVTGSLVNFDTSSAITVPVGNVAQRPVTGVTGQFRFNTTSNTLEIYDNSEWTAVGVPSFTVITDQQFSGDGSTVAFTLTADSTTAATIVSINGVQQIPITAYSVTNNILTFTEAPAEADQIDVRVLITTTSVTSISNLSGNAVVSVSDTSATTTITGDLLVTGNATISGNIAANQITNGSSAVQIPTPNGNVNIDVGGFDNVVTVTTNLVAVVGNISASGDVTAVNFNNTSDARLKANVTPIVDAGQTIDSLNGVGYDWINGSGHAYGMIAQAVEEVLPEAVHTDENGIKSVNYTMVIPFLVETVKELRQDIAEIKNQLKK